MSREDARAVAAWVADSFGSHSRAVPKLDRARSPSWIGLHWEFSATGPRTSAPASRPRAVAPAAHDRAVVPALRSATMVVVEDAAEPLSPLKGSIGRRSL